MRVTERGRHSQPHSERERERAREIESERETRERQERETRDTRQRDKIQRETLPHRLPGHLSRSRSCSKSKYRLATVNRNRLCRSPLTPAPVQKIGARTSIPRCSTGPPRPRTWRSARRRPLLLAGPRPPERGAPLNYAAGHLRKGVQPGDTGAARLHQRTQQHREKQGVLQLPPAPHGRAPLRGRPRGMSAISPVK